MSSILDLPVGNPGQPTRSAFVDSLVNQDDTAVIEETTDFNVEVDETDDDDAVETDIGALPDCITLSEVADAPATLELYSSYCLRCDAIHNSERLASFNDSKNPDAKRRFNGVPLNGEKRDCHFNKGNTACPAGQIVIVFTGVRRHTLAKLRTLRNEHGATGRMFLSELGELAKSTLSEQDIAWIMTELNNG